MIILAFSFELGSNDHDSDIYDTEGIPASPPPPTYPEKMTTNEWKLVEKPWFSKEDKLKDRQ